MKQLSIKGKIVFWYTAIMVVLAVIALAALNSFTQEMIESELKEQLTNAVSSAAKRPAGPVHDMPPRDSNRPDMAMGYRMYDRGVHMVYYDDEFNQLSYSLPFSFDSELDFVSDKIREVSYNGEVYYVYDLYLPSRMSDDGHWIRGVISASAERYGKDSVVFTNIFLAGLLVIIAAIGGYFIVRRALKPVNKIAGTATEIAGSRDLSRRINIGSGNDEIHRLANTVDEMLDRLEQSFEKEKQFTSDASHELRTPVAVILSECEYMKACAKTVEDFEESADSIQRQAEKMSKLISELLTISRMDKNTLQLEFETVDLGELLEFVCDEQEEINPSGAAMTRNIAHGVTVRGDRILLARLFINLISNAYRYSESDSTITVSLRADNGNAVVAVRDEGIGIPPEHQDKIWERFYQVDPSRTSDGDGGMGLGLSMVKWIARCHGGDVSVTSTVGEGSTFEFVMPI